MIPAAFEYHSPSTVAEASRLLATLGEDAKVLAGGQSLIPLMKLRLASPRHLIDINGIPGLAGIREEGGALLIGGLARETDLEESDLVRSTRSGSSRRTSAADSAARCRCIRAT